MVKATDFHDLFVLVADDDPKVCEVLGEAIEIAGLFKGVIQAKDGGEALQKLGRQKFGLIVLDYFMPKMNAPEIIKKISGNEKDQNFKTPIILVSGKMDEAMIEEAKELGVNHCISKPFVIEKVVETVIGALGL